MYVTLSEKKDLKPYQYNVESVYIYYDNNLHQFLDVIQPTVLSFSRSRGAPGVMGRRKEGKLSLPFSSFPSPLAVRPPRVTLVSK